MPNISQEASLHSNDKEFSEKKADPNNKDAAHPIFQLATMHTSRSQEFTVRFSV